MDFEIIGEIRHPETFARGSVSENCLACVKFMVLATGVNAKATLWYVYPMGQSVKLKFTGTRLQVSANVNSRLNVIRIYNHEQI